MYSNRLKLNFDKTQFIWLGSRYQRQKVGITSIQLGISEVKFQSNVNYLGVIIDDLLSMKNHVQRIYRSSYYQLWQMWTVRKSLPVESCEALIHDADSITVTVCFTALKNFNSTCCSLSFVSLLAWFSVSGNSIRSPCKFATSCIGSQWGRGSNSRFVQRFTNVYMKELHLTSLRWCCQSLTHQPCNVCDRQHGATWSSPAQKQFDLVREVSTFPGQPCGTLYQSTSNSTNRLNHLRNNWKRFCIWRQTVAKKLY